MQLPWVSRFSYNEMKQALTARNEELQSRLDSLLRRVEEAALAPVPAASTPAVSEDEDDPGGTIMSLRNFATKHVRNEYLHAKKT